MRPEHHNRPLLRKMKAKLESKLPTHDQLLKASKLRALPDRATPFGWEGLPAALLWACSDGGSRGDDEGEGGDGGDGDGTGGAHDPEWATRGPCTMAVLALEYYMRLAVDNTEITVAEMMYELRVALMDRVVWELAQFHHHDLRDEIVIRDSHWFLQCWVHKYKNNVQSWWTLDADAPLDAPGFSRARLLKVAKELEQSCELKADRKMYQAVKLALMGKVDALSQSALMWALVCPHFLEALDQDPSCWLEHSILYTLGMAYLAWDMPHLTDAERTYRIELCEAVLVYSLGGEQLYLPFYNESDKGAEPGLVGILSGKIGSFTSQNLLALLQNGAARRQFRQQYPDA